jgi:anti-sigma factor ChrR (cupin superfamily)
MLINADFSRRASITPDQYCWVASPQAGVERVMLDRLGGEDARATSIVRYAPGSRFPRHAHPGGEEILVLAGTFTEGTHDFPAGWYLRNPPGSAHEPSSAEGAILFVKLCQMSADESRPVRVDTRDPACWRRHGSREICPLFASDGEVVVIERLVEGECLFAGQVQGAEIVVLSRELHALHERYAFGSWIRLPPGEYPEFRAGDRGAELYVKSGHLPTARALQG